MATNLTFSSSERYSVRQFINKSQASKIDIIKSPKTGKYFMSDDAGRAIGGVSEAVVDALGNGENITPIVSLVTTPEGASFYLMHKNGEGSRPVHTFTA